MAGEERTREITTYQMQSPRGPVTIEVQEQAGYVRTPAQEAELRELLAVLVAANAI